MATSEAVSYTSAELLSVMCSRSMDDGTIVFAGVGVPLLGATLAQRRHAPSLTVLFEGGILGPRIQPGRLPPSTNEMRTAEQANMVLSPTDVLALLQRGYVDIGFIGGAQVDQYGNVNSSYIGSYGRPTTRLPGTGGGNDIASLSETIVIMPHEMKRFVAQVDFVTSPGFLTGGTSRHDSGLLVGGVKKVITNLCTFDFEQDSRRLRVASLHPRTSIAEVLANMDFEPLVPEGLPTERPPLQEELDLLRHLDPTRLYLR